MDQRPNIILVIVDTLRYDRLGSSGYRPALTPNIDKLVANGLSFSNNHANGCVTSVAFPSIFTSTLPLDYGGYEDGIHNRPTSFPEILKNVGYENYGLITGHPCSSHLDMIEVSIIFMILLICTNGLGLYTSLSSQS